MKYSFNWLKQYVSIGLTPDALAHRLTMAGLEVEAMHPAGDDVVIEIEVTPNRADCLSVQGITRELAAILNKSRRKPAIGKLRFPKARFPIAIEDKKACRRYVGTVIKNVTVGPSPEHLRKPIETLGGRSISSVVDITNYCLMETGQPLHAFDLDKLIGGRVIVRRARKGEKITTIDEKEHELDESILVIADEKRPVAIAGIMGGKDTEVTASTKNILLESAWFDPVLIRRAGRKLGLSSDSSYRFERGVDIEGVKAGSDRALTLILKHAGGTVTAYSDAYASKASMSKSIPLTVGQINAYLGSDISIGRCKGILAKLEIPASGANGRLTVRPPSFRPDLKETVDLIEEIARIEGYDKLPTSFPTVKISTIPIDDTRASRESLKQALCSQGFDEIITYSMTNQEALRRAGQGGLQGPRITNPLSLDQEMMRPSLLPGMLGVISFNVNRGQRSLRLFEAGKIYSSGQEQEMLSIAMTGAAEPDWRQPKERAFDFYDLKGAASASLRCIIGDAALEFVPLDADIFEPGAAAEILLVNRPIGQLGRIRAGILKSYIIKDADVWFAQIELRAVYDRRKPAPLYRPIPAYPAIVRDISFTFDKQIPYDTIVQTIRAAASKNLIEINFKEDYTTLIADKIESGHRGVLISLIYQSYERTLAEDEVNAEHQAILRRLVDACNIRIR